MNEQKRKELEDQLDSFLSQLIEKLHMAELPHGLRQYDVSNTHNNKVWFRSLLHSESYDYEEARENYLKLPTPKNKELLEAARQDLDTSVDRAEKIANIILSLQMNESYSKELSNNDKKEEAEKQINADVHSAFSKLKSDLNHGESEESKIEPSKMTENSNNLDSHVNSGELVKPRASPPLLIKKYTHHM